jgi:small subunit ribosomal protein S20
MPIIKSAKKRVKVAAKATARNVKTKRSLKEATKAFYAALAKGKPAEVTQAYKEAVSAVDIAAKKNIIHKNKANRKKHQLSTALKTSSVKLEVAKKKAPTAKPATKKVVKPVAKTAVKKTPAKKVAKAPAKKPVAKKAAK